MDANMTLRQLMLLVGEITVHDAARIIGKNVTYIWVGAQQGKLDFAEAIKGTGQKYRYSIKPGPLAERQGITVKELYEMVWEMRNGIDAGASVVPIGRVREG